MKCAHAGCLTIQVTASSTSANPRPWMVRPSSTLVPKSWRAGLNSNAPSRQYSLAHSGLSFGRIARVDAAAGEDERELLHVLLRVAGVDAEGVQLHELAGVVLIDVPGGILVVVQIGQHRRMLERREHQILELPERMRPDRPIGVVGDEPAQIRLRLMHAEVVEPEPHHLFLELSRE